MRIDSPAFPFFFFVLTPFLFLHLSLAPTPLLFPPFLPFAPFSSYSAFSTDLYSFIPPPFSPLSAYFSLFPLFFTSTLSPSSPPHSLIMYLPFLSHIFFTVLPIFSSPVFSSSFFYSPISNFPYLIDHCLPLLCYLLFSFAPFFLVHFISSYVTPYSAIPLSFSPSISAV